MFRAPSQFPPTGRCAAIVIAAVLVWGAQDFVRRVRGAAPADAAARPAPATRPSTGPSNEDAPAPEQAGVPLVSTDRDADDLLRQANISIGHRDYDQAIDLLHTLITSDCRSFARSPDDPRRYVAARAVATELLGRLPVDALQAYARRYDPAAGTLFEQGQRTQDEAILRRVGDEYFHTHFGGRALNLLGSLAFDRGDALDAASAWERVYREHKAGSGNEPPIDRALLLAKAAVAYHLAGADDRARELLDLLRSQHADSKATIAGQPTPLVSFVQQALGQPPVETRRAEVATEWTAPFGAPDAAAVMPAAAQQLFPLWAAPADADQRLALSRAVAGVGDVSAAVRVSIEGGRAVAATEAAGAARRFALPAFVHPLVLKDAVICRLEEGVAAYDPGTGRLLWQTVGLPLHSGNAAARGASSNPFAALTGDMGRHLLSAGADKIFTVCRFRRIDPATYRGFELAGGVDGSTLAAVAAKNGQIAWEVGNGQGADDMLKGAKFLSAPCYRDGRLYVLAKQAGSYWTVCLDAEKGTPVWETAVGTVPTGGVGEALSWQAAFTVELLTERGSPPSLADGRLYVTTNAGLVAALDAASGRPLWAYRYDSTVSGAATDEFVRPVAEQAYLLVSANRPLRPANPVVVSGGRVICLPADSTSALAFAAADEHPSGRRAGTIRTTCRISMPAGFC